MKYLASVAALCCLAASPVTAVAVSVSAPAAVGEYANGLLNKLTGAWNVPASTSEQWGHVRLHVDARGRLTYCASVDGKEGELTRSACQTLRDMGSLGNAPASIDEYDVFFNLWQGGMGPMGTATLKPAAPPLVADNAGINPSAATVGGVAVPGAGSRAAQPAPAVPSAPAATPPAVRPDNAGYSGAVATDAQGAGIEPNRATIGGSGTLAGTPAATAGTTPAATAPTPPQGTTPPPAVAAETAPVTMPPVAQPPQPVVDATNMYVHDAMKRIQRYITLPEDLQPGSYTLKYIVRVEGDGRINDIKLVQPSGCAALDKAITIAITEAYNLGTPPDKEDLHLTFVVER